ncbi:MAG: carbohydrate kinase family protein [Kiritimatiellae bacterium]|nr:carbohydrate kinase family protein [Kiritimatiellia bacterium]
MAQKITLAGNIIVDNVKTITAWPDKGMLVPITAVKRSPGGAVPNSGIDLKTLDPSIEVAAFGKVGADDAGDFVTEFMSGHGLDVSGVQKVEGTPTSFTDVMTVASTGERTFFNMHGADSLLVPEDVDPSKLGCDIFHLGYLLLLDGLDAEDQEYGTKAARLLAKVKAAGIKTSLDIVSEQSDRFARVVRPALKYCDYVVINEVEGALATGLPARDGDNRITEENLRKICEALFGLGVSEQVVVHCPEISVSLDRTGCFCAVPSLELPSGWIKGSVGAGDAFCAGMLYSFLKGMPAEEGMRLASCTAAMNLSVPDSVSGAKSLAETLALESRFPRRK